MLVVTPEKRERLRLLVASGVAVKVAAHNLGLNYNTALPHARDARPPRFTPAVKVCVVCGASFTPAKATRPNRWRARRVCGNRCAGLMVRR